MAAMFIIGLTLGTYMALDVERHQRSGAPGGLFEFTTTRSSAVEPFNPNPEADDLATLSLRVETSGPPPENR